MTLEHLIQRVNSKDTFLEFLKALESNWTKDQELREGAQLAPFLPGPSGWENLSVGGFLEAMHAWACDSQWLDDEPSWRMFAELLLAGKGYE